MLQKFKYHIKERGLFGTAKRFTNCWKINGFDYTVRQMFKSFDQAKLLQATSPTTFMKISENNYYNDSRAQNEFFSAYKKDPKENRMLDLLNILKKENNPKGVVLYPLSYDISIKQRPEHILRVLADEGYLCLMCKIAESHERSKIDQIGKRLYVTDMLDECIAYFQDKKPIVYITYPFYYYLTKHIENAYFIYDVLDNLKIFSNYCKEMEEDHRYLLRDSNLVTYSSHTMHEEIAKYNKNFQLIENGVWLQDFEMEEDSPIPENFQLKKKRNQPLKIGYHGVISELLDFGIIEAILLNENVEIFLIGPVVSFDHSMEQNLQETIARLNKYRNFTLLGFVPYANLKYYLHQFDFCIIPFRITEGTDAVSPLKLFEYIASGKPVIATPTKTLLKYDNIINIRLGEDFSNFFADRPVPAIDVAKYDELRQNNKWETLVAPLVSKLNPIFGGKKEAPAIISKKIVDIINVNFFDWDGKVLYKGGAERYVYDLARLCQDMDLDVRILQNANSFFTKQLDGIPIIGMPSQAGHDWDKLSDKYNSFCSQSDLIIASPLDLACNLHYSHKSIGINHGIYWDDKFTKIGTYDIHRYRKVFKALKNCSKSVCVDTNFINWLRTYEWQLGQKCEYIPNYIEREKFMAFEKDFSQDLTILFPRRMYEARGLYITLEAFNYLLPKYPNIKLHFVGQASGDDVNAALTFTKKFRTQTSWYELDMDKMPDAYRQSHIVLIPTMYAEGTSLSCLEGMATNNAVIATNIGGLPNLILDNFNGMLISPDATNLINSIERLINDRSLLKRLAANALLTAEAFDKRRWLSKWNALIEETLHVNY